MADLTDPARDLEAGSLAMPDQLMPPGLSALDLRIDSSNGWLAGVVLFLFLAGVLPLSIMVFLLFTLLCLATCIRAYTLHQYAQELHGAQGRRQILERTFNLARTTHGSFYMITGHSINLANLRLSLVDRDFTGGDYESLLALDQGDSIPQSSQIGVAELATLPTHFHTAKAGSCKAKGAMCSVCLDDFSEGVKVTTLRCLHTFHSDCIEPWLRQKGKNAQCPMCKTPVFCPRM